MSELNAEQVQVQSLLHQIKVIIETEHGQDASGLLQKEGWHLLSVSNNIFEDSENRFVYSLGCTRSRDQWDNWENNF